MKILQIDDKWSVEYDPCNNDKPIAIFRHGERCPFVPEGWDNMVVAMFYELLKLKGDNK